MKSRIDRKSLKFRLWIYFGLFAALLMAILWFLQIFFLNNYYEYMKTNETHKAATSIINEYGNENFHDFIINTARKNDLNIQVISPNMYLNSSGYPVESENEDDFEGYTETRLYLEEMQEIKDELFKSNSYNVSQVIPDPLTGVKTLAYCAYLDNTPGNETILYIFSPLYPVESTVSILANQLVYVTVISLVVAFLMAFWLSRKITKPITDITQTAEELAEGKYGIIFDGGHYSEIIKLADTLTYTSLELARADNMQKDLIANVSHDLRTPLTMVKSYAEMIKDLSGDNPEKRNEHLQVIINEADRLNVLVTDLLELSKMQSGKESMNNTNFSMKSTIETILDSYKALVEQEDYKIIFTSYGEGRVFADETRLKQVLSNLINNSLKFCGKDRTVEVNMKETEDTVKVEVSDHGVGIAKRDLKHIWERYYKASTNRKRSGGTGLGLSIVKEILIMHDAKFGVNSELRHGSTFWFELKKWRPVDEEE